MTDDQFKPLMRELRIIQIGHCSSCGGFSEGIVSKRRGSRYESGRSSHWFKIKNPNHPAGLRLLQEDWNG